MTKKHIVVAMTGASGAALGIQTLRILRTQVIESHLILSNWARRTIELETDLMAEDATALADHVYQADDLSATISSGSFRTDGMIVIPCSMKTLSAIANGFSYSLITRAADVTIKEHRPLILVTRETPLSAIHLQNMLTLAQMGVFIMPPCVAYYNRPETVEETVAQTAGRAVDLLGIPNESKKAWDGNVR